MEIKAAWWAVRGDLDLFRYMAGYVPIPGSDAVKQTLTTSFFENEAEKIENKTLEEDNNILRFQMEKETRYFERIMADLRAGRVPILSETDETGEEIDGEEVQRLRDRKYDEDEDDDSIKKFFSRDDPVRRVMMHI